MPAADLEQLILSISANTRQTQRALKKLEGDTCASTKRVERQFDAMSRKIEGSFGRLTSYAADFGERLLVGFVAGCVTGIVAQLRSVVKGVAEIGDKAKIAGLRTQAVQELSYVAEINRVSMEALVGGFKELSLGADEFIQTGQGSGAESFRRLGFNAVDLAAKLKDPSDLFTEIIGKLEDMDGAAQILIADELFGGQFVQLISQGEKGIRAMIQAAHDTGAVMDDEMIAKGPEILSLPRGATVTPMDAIPRMPRLASRQGAACDGGVHVTVGVNVGDDGNLQAYVKNVSRQQASELVADYDRAGWQRVGRDFAEARRRNAV